MKVHGVDKEGRPLCRDARASKVLITASRDPRKNHL